MNAKHPIEAGAACVVAIMLTACSGGGYRTTTAPVPQVPVSATRAAATLKITIPSASTPSAKTRKPAYVSPATQSIAIAFTPAAGGNTQTFNEDLTPATNPECVASLISPEVCTVNLTLSPGNYTATFATYDGLLDGNGNPQGNVLSQNQSLPVTIAAGQTNAINVTLQGVPASVVLVPSATSALSRTGTNSFALSKCFANQSVSVVGVDADGNYILGPGAPTPSLTSSDTTQLAVTSPVAASPALFTLTRPGIPNANTTITLTATMTPGSGGGSALTSSFAVTFDGTVCGTFSEYPLPANSNPYGITLGPDGALWLAEAVRAAISRVTTSGAIVEYGDSVQSSEPFWITPGSDGALWFTEIQSNQVGRMTTAGGVTEFTIPTAGSEPQVIVTGADHALWFTENNGNKVGRTTTGGSFTEYAIPTIQAGANGLAVGPDGALWFTESLADKIGRITTAGSITEFPVPTAQSLPFMITAGPDGALWFTEINGNNIGRVTTAGSFTEYALQTADAVPWGISAGPDGALWFTEINGNNIGRITPSGSITEYPVPTSNSDPAGITTGPDGALWFTEAYGNQVGRLQ